MKNLILILFIFVIASCKKEEVNPELSKEFTIQSVYANANYKIKIAFPENYDASKQKYATLYILDGEENFSFVAANVKSIGNDYSTSNVLVVSIGYGNNRATDYTPTKADEGEGGAEYFMRFIKLELIPRMESEFGADTLRKNRIILGHSFGGLLAAYAFTNYNEVFGNYLMLSPSLWYDNEILLRLEQQNRGVNADKDQLVYLGLGELEDGRMHSPFIAFHQRLLNSYSKMKITSHIEAHLNHVGSKNPNIKEGLTYYFQNR